MSIGARIAALIDEMGSGPVFVHSDPFRTARLVKPVRDRDAYIDSHIGLIREAAAERALWIPSFNYDYGRSRTFDIAKSESQLGPIPERFRVTVAAWRTPIPMFAVAGTGGQPRQSWGAATDPFGSDSMFAELVGNDGVVLYYGDTFHYNTLVHHAERVGRGPVYRYDKRFPGQVIFSDGHAEPGTLLYHVRPLGTGLDYDWPRLLDESIEAGVTRRLDGNPEILAASARGLYDLWVSNMRQDPLALLDDKTRKWVEPAVEELGRRFVITDFEGPQTEIVESQE